MPIFRVSKPVLKHARNEPFFLCFVNFLADRGGDPFVRSKVRVFTLFLLMWLPRYIYIYIYIYINRVFPTFLSSKSDVYIYIYIYIYLAFGHQKLVFYRTFGARDVYLRLSLA